MTIPLYSEIDRLRAHAEAMAIELKQSSCLLEIVAHTFEVHSADDAIKRANNLVAAYRKDYP